MEVRNLSSERPLFILAGNGPYANRGCEAITRGTVKIIRKHFKDPLFICHSHFQSDEQFRIQKTSETDDTITHLQSFRMNKKKAIRNFWRPRAWSYVYRSVFKPNRLKYKIYHNMMPYLNDASAVLSVGGDNYSLDYGIPTPFTGLDDIVLERKRPLAIWGASVGPFDKMPDYEKYMSHHLREVTGIFARESATVDYLKSIGVVDNIFTTADPAFLLDPVKPESIEDELPIDRESIGINLSPLVAKYVTGGDTNKWIDLAASTVEQLSQKSEMPIYLIPHVTNPSSNDHAFMQQVVSRISSVRKEIVVVPPKYNAAETKWIISRMLVFAGARTHSTIAAISSGIPTLSLAYSIKARGINQDIFDHTRYCIEPEEFNTILITDKITAIIDNAPSIRRELIAGVPIAQSLAFDAGRKLKRLIEDA